MQTVGCSSGVKNAPQWHWKCDTWKSPTVAFNQLNLSVWCCGGVSNAKFYGCISKHPAGQTFNDVSIMSLDSYGNSGTLSVPMLLLNC